MATSWTSTDLQNIEEAIAKGVLEVQYTDKKIRYRTLKEMLSIRNEIKKSLGITKKTSRVLAKTDKGLGC